MHSPVQLLDDEQRMRSLDLYRRRAQESFNDFQSEWCDEELKQGVKKAHRTKFVLKHEILREITHLNAAGETSVDEEFLATICSASLAFMLGALLHVDTA